jgi:hypothetical protein
MSDFQRITLFESASSWNDANLFVREVAGKPSVVMRSFRHFLVRSPQTAVPPAVPPLLVLGTVASQGPWI